MNKGVLALFVTALVLIPSAWADGTYKVLHAFGKGKDGGGVYAGVTIDNQGNLYGTTGGGGDHGEGTVFELRRGLGGKWTEAVIHSFCAQLNCTDGALPFAGLAIDEVGDLYGAAGGGDRDSGVTFQLLRSSDLSNMTWSFQVLYNVGSGSSPIPDLDGNLFGPMGPGLYHGGAITELSSGGAAGPKPISIVFAKRLHARTA